jgi:nitrogen fixation protein FixH
MMKPTMFSRPLTGRKVLAYFVGFFSVIFGANLIMVFFAISTFSGVETDDAYRKGRDYNEALAEAAEQQALGWTVQINAQLGDGRVVTCTAILLDEKGQGVSDLKIEAIFRRPTRKGIDRSVALTELERGSYSGRIELPAEGNWEIRIDAIGPDGERFRSQKQFSLTG